MSTIPDLIANHPLQWKRVRNYAVDANGVQVPCFGLDLIDVCNYIGELQESLTTANKIGYMHYQCNEENCASIDSITAERDSLKAKVEELEGDLRASRAHETQMCKMYQGGKEYERRLFEAACAAMPAYLEDYDEQMAAINAVSAAKALLAELAKPKEG